MSRRSPVPVDILLALAELGIDAMSTGAGDEAKAICPNPEHEDHTPSWSIDLDSGLHHCFSCGWGGNFVTLVEAVKNVDRGKAKDWARERQLRDISEGKTRQDSQRREYAEITEADLWEFTTDFPEDQMERRGVDLGSLAAYDVRWHPDGAWVIPTRDPATHRWVGYQLKYLNGDVVNHPPNMKKTGRVFGIELIDKTQPRVIVVESPLDAVKLHALGCRNVVALYGAYLDAEQAEELLMATGEITFYVLFLDDDEAGRKGVSKFLGRMQADPVYVAAYTEPRKVSTYMVFGPATKKDPGDLTENEIVEALADMVPGFRAGFM